MTNLEEISLVPESLKTGEIDYSRLHNYNNKVGRSLPRNYTYKERKDVIKDKLKKVMEEGVIIRGEIKFNKYRGFHDGTFFILDNELVFFRFDNRHKQYKEWIYSPKSIEKIYFPDPTNLGSSEIDHGLLETYKKNGTFEYNYYSVTTSEFDFDIN